MINGILWAIGAGVMLGLYALPEKYVKGYKYENTWSLFFLIALVVFPLVVSFGMISDFGEVLKMIPAKVLLPMMALSFIWGVGVQLWSKAIDYIGMALGFSIFSGAVIMVGSILPFIVDGLPAVNSLLMILGGLLVILLGIICNGRAGMLRAQEEGAARQTVSREKSVKGIVIALTGGLFATGFSLANAIGVGPITEAVVACGNPEWKSAIAVMFVIYMSGAIYVLPYFAYQLTKNHSWGDFRAPALGKNLLMTTIMAFLNYAASATFAYAAFSLGNAGNTVGYAIYNTVSVLLAVIGGLLAKEWVHASKKTRTLLYVALFAMMLGVVVIALGNSMN